MTVDSTAATALPPIVIERTLSAPPAEVWEMWTTKDGLESWWGPEGFDSTVEALDVQVGGRVVIAMKAVKPEIVAWMESAGQPTTSYERFTFTELSPVTRLAFLEQFNYDPGVEPYDCHCAMTLTPVSEGTRMTFRTNALHNEQWTQLSSTGWHQSFDKLAQALQR